MTLALLGYFSGALSLMMMIALESGKKFSSFGFTAGTVGFLFFNVCIGFFFSSSAHLFLELATGKGRAAGLFVLIGLSEFTKTLLVAFALVCAAIPSLAPFRIIIVLIVLLFQTLVVLFMMHKAYGLSKISTFFALVASFIPSVISLFAFGILMFSFIFWMLSK